MRLFPCLYGLALSQENTVDEGEWLYTIKTTYTVNTIKTTYWRFVIQFEFRNAIQTNAIFNNSRNQDLQSVGHVTSSLKMTKSPKKLNAKLSVLMDMISSKVTNSLNFNNFFTILYKVLGALLIFAEKAEFGKNLKVLFFFAFQKVSLNIKLLFWALKFSHP